MSKKPNKEIDYYTFPIKALKAAMSDSGLDISHLCDIALVYAIWKVYENKLKINEIRDNDRFNMEAYHDAMESLCLRNHPDPQAVIDNYKRLCETHFKDCKVFTTISREVLRDAQINANVRGDFYKEQLLASLALRSILGSWADRMCKAVCWDFVLSRMAGEAKRVSENDLPPFVKKYSSRKMRKKMIDALCDYWGYSYYAPRGTRVPWFGLGMTYYELEQYATKHKRRKRAENRR